LQSGHYLAVQIQTPKLTAGNCSMSSNENQTPDLASILRTLASLAPQSRQQGQPYIQTQETSFPPQVEHAPAQQLWHQNYTQVAELPRTFPPQIEHPPAQQGWHQNVSQVPELSRSSPPVNPAIKVVDPATIIEWSAGLRCVMKTVAKHENMLHDIRRVSPQSDFSLAKLTIF
jgi:hypothetical protein